MSHELRTPLNAVLLGLQMALEQTPAQPSNTAECARRQMLVETESACDAAVDILNEFLLFDKLENGALALFKESVPILDLVRSSAQMFSLQMRAKNISFTVENNGASVADWQSSGVLKSIATFMHPVFTGSLLVRPPDEISEILSSPSLYAKDAIQLDKSKVIRVLRNILSNAIKFTPHSGNISLNMRFESSAPADEESLPASASHGSLFSLQRWASVSGSSAQLTAEPSCSSAKGLELGHSRRLGGPAPLMKSTPARKSFTAGRESRPSASANQMETDNTKKPLSSTFPAFPSITKRANGNETTERNLAATSPALSCVSAPNAASSPIMDVCAPKQVHTGWLVLELTDDGAGISPENQTRLFKEVVQFHPEKLQGGGGSGLGTMISKGIVELHGGSISVYSEGEGFGSTLTVRLPMTRQYDDIALTPADPPTQVASDAPISEGKNRSANLLPDAISDPSSSPRSPLNEPQDTDTTTSPLTPRIVMKSTVAIDADAQSLFSPVKRGSGMRTTSSPPRTRAPSNDDSGDGDEYLERVCVDGESSPVTTIATVSTPVATPVSTPFLTPVTTPFLRVLVVDDSALTRKMMIRLLDRRGYTSVEAADGFSALCMIQDSLAPGTQASGAEPFDLVLMDNMMPVMNGIDATRKMRLAGFSGSVFGISGSVMDSEVKAFEKAGANLVLTKPIDMKAFHIALTCVRSNRDMLQA